MFTVHAPHNPPTDPNELEAGLLSFISSAWRIGWMPADLLSAIEHECDTRSTRIAAALILKEHHEQGYDHRLTPRWQSQLIAVREAAEDATDYGVGRGKSWVAARMKLWFFLGFLPGLPRIGALPGEADPAAPRADGQPVREGTIDHNVLRRVRALLAKAESTDFDAESEAFTAKAQALIAEHSLAAALRDGIGETNTDGPDAIRITVERPYEREKFQLLAKIAMANRSRAILHERLGFASRIGERLAGETKRATEEAASAAGSSASVLPVLAGRADRVEKAVGAAFPRLSRARRSQAAFDGSGYNAGVEAANRANLATHRPLAS
jgi:hypothetical protein